MPQSKKDGSNGGSSMTGNSSKNDQQSTKRKSGQGMNGGKGQKDKEEMGKEKAIKETKVSNKRNRSGS